MPRTVALQPHRLTDPALIRAYVQGGHGRLTLASTRTGARFTYRFRLAREARGDRRPIFVQLLRGPSNEADYTFLGTLWPDSYRHGRKSHVGEDAPSARAFAWFARRVLGEGADPAELDLEVWHEGVCACCGRALTVPESIARGIGPECAKKAVRG